MSVYKTKSRRPSYSRSFNRGRCIMANDEMEMPAAPETADLLLEVEDVKELLETVLEGETGEAVTVETEVDDQGNFMAFDVNGNTYTVEAEGDEEVVESSRNRFRAHNRVTASTRRGMTHGRTVRSYRR